MIRYAPFASPRKCSCPCKLIHLKWLVPSEAPGDLRGRSLTLQRVGCVEKQAILIVS